MNEKLSLEDLRQEWSSGRDIPNEILEKYVVLQPDEVKLIKSVLLNHLTDRLRPLNKIISSGSFIDYDTTATSILELREQFRNKPEIERVLSCMWRINELYWDKAFYE